MRPRQADLVNPGTARVSPAVAVVHSHDAAIAHVLERFEADREARIALLHQAIRASRRLRRPSKAAEKRRASAACVLDRSSGDVIRRVRALVAVRSGARDFATLATAFPTMSLLVAALKAQERVAPIAPAREATHVTKTRPASRDAGETA